MFSRSTIKSTYKVPNLSTIISKLTYNRVGTWANYSIPSMIFSTIALCHYIIIIYNSRTRCPLIVRGPRRLAHAYIIRSRFSMKFYLNGRTSYPHFAPKSIFLQGMAYALEMQTISASNALSTEQCIMSLEMICNTRETTYLCTN